MDYCLYCVIIDTEKMPVGLNHLDGSSRIPLLLQKFLISE